MRQPPLSVDNGASCMGVENPSPISTCRAVAAAACALMAASWSPSSCSLATLSCHSSALQRGCAVVRVLCLLHVAVACFSSWSSCCESKASIASISRHSASSSASSAPRALSELTSSSNAERPSRPGSSCDTAATSRTDALMRPAASRRTSVLLPLPLTPSNA
eukprot:3161220-Rhodomonas_salina.1